MTARVIRPRTAGSGPPPRAPRRPLDPPFDAPLEEMSDVALLEHFRSRRSVVLVPIADPEHTARDRVDAVLEGIFELNGERHRVDLPAGWTENPSADVEWLILLHKFYHAVGLGLAYVESGDRRYARRWVELVESWLDAVPLDFFPADVAGRRIQNWIHALHLFLTAPGETAVPPRFLRRLIESIREHVVFLLENLTPARNHRTIELCAIFLAAVAFPEFEESGAWLRFSTGELAANIAADFLDDGVHCELSTDYHHLVLKNYLHIRRLASLNGIELPAGIDAGIVKALRFALHVHKPDGAIPSFSDGDPRSFVDLLELGHELYGDPELLHAATRGAAGRRPAERSAAFRESGYVVVRGGWGEGEVSYEDEQHLVLDCGPFGAGNHGHFDLLSFELAAWGRSLIVDPGRYTYDESGDVNWRAVFRRTSYHNTVVVDGKNQARYVFHRDKLRRRGPEAEGALDAFVTADSFDYVAATARSHEYEAVHERRVFFLRRRYWIVTDILRSGGTHSYDLFFHLAPEAQGRVTAARRGGTVVVRAPGLLMAQPLDPRVDVSIESGFVSPAYGVKLPAPVVRFSTRGGAVAFHTLLHPHGGGDAEAPEVALDRVEVRRSGGAECPPDEATALRLELSSRRGRWADLLFTAASCARGPWTFDGERSGDRLLFLRRDALGRTVERHRWLSVPGKRGAAGAGEGVR